MDGEETRLKIVGSSDEINCEMLTYSEQRSLIFHLLYSIDRYDYDISFSGIIDNFYKGFSIIIPEYSRVYKEAESVIEHREELDNYVKPLLVNWRFERIGIITRLIMRMAIWELLNTDVEPKVIINEAIELAKCFAEKDAYKFVNGILDKFVKQREHKAIQENSE